MKNYEITCYVYDEEEKELKTRNAGKNNPIQLGIENENYRTNLQANNAIQEMDIANLTNEQVAQINAQGDRRPTESAIARVKARAMATQKEEDKQYE